ncbi:MAG: hypothetical protein J07HX5_00693, partial [halophilic archaeon J07HX5]
MTSPVKQATTAKTAVSAAHPRPGGLAGGLPRFALPQKSPTPVPFSERAFSGGVHTESRKESFTVPEIGRLT